MKKIKFRENGEEHNFWQNYTDLMSGFLIVFIIASLVAYNKYKGYVELYYGVGVTEANINDIVVNAKLYKQIKEFQEAQNQLQSKYFAYNSKYDRFECTVDVLFKPEDPVIPDVNKAELIAGGTGEAELAENPVRFALIEVVNIYDKGLTFEPI